MFVLGQSQSVIRHLAMSLHLGRWKDSYMMIGTAYFDASGKKESQALVLAGFLSHPVEWLKFETDWKYCLAWYGKTQLHMKHYAHSEGEYSVWKGDEPLRRRFLGDLIRVIKDNLGNSFAIALHMAEYAEVDRKYRLREWAHPYALVGVHIIGAVKAWAIKYQHDVSMIDHVFEAGDEGKGDLFRLSSTHLGIDPIFKPKEASVAFQAADLIAYEHYRANQKILGVGEEMIDVGAFRIPFQLLSGVPGSMEWGLLLKQNIIDDCQRYGVPLRDYASRRRKA